MVIHNLSQLPEWALDLLDHERVGHIGVLDDAGRPRVLPVTYARCDGAIWSIVDNKSKRQGTELARLRWLRERPDATLTVDHYDEDWSALAWIQLIGDVAVVQPAAHRRALAALTARYQQYQSDPPPGPLLRLSPRRTVCWRAVEM